MDTLAILIFFIAFFMLTWWRREYGMFFIIYALPLYVVRFSVAGLPSTLLEGMVLIVWGVWAIQQRQRILDIWKKRVFRTEYIIFISILSLFFLASIIAIFVAPQKYAALGLWRAYILEPLLFFAVLLDTVKEKKQIVRVCGVILLSGISIALYGIFQKITGFGIPEPWMLERRITSTYPYPNAVGLYLAPIIALCTPLLVRQYCHPKQREGSRVFWQKVSRFFGIRLRMTLVYGVSLAILLTAIYFAQTEAALAALAAGGIFYGFFWNKKLRRIVLILCTFSIFFLVVSPPLAHFVQEKIFLKDWSGKVRIMVWQETIPMIRDHWFFGAGLAGYPEAVRPYHAHTFIEIFQYPHNIILNFWSELGIMGLIAFELLIGWYFFILLRTLFILRKVPEGDEKSFVRALTFGCMYAMSTIIIHGFVDVPYFKNDLSVFFWLLIGLGTILYNSIKRIQNTIGEVGESG